MPSARDSPIHVDDRIRQTLRAVLPFHLTGGQRQALKDIGEDMQRAAADEPAAAG